MADSLFEQHRETLEGALNAIRSRSYWSAYPEVPSGKIYGDTAKKDGQAAFAARHHKRFELDQPGSTGAVGDERSPFGITLGIRYPKADLDALIPAVQSAGRAWAAADVETRVGVCLEILHRLNRRSFELANAVMHTTGQGFMMAFQAGGPHAQDRGLEAVAYAYDELRRTPPEATWTKKVGKDETVSLKKRYRIVPRGIAITVGCSTFPTWNGYPGIFASLTTGNAVIVKPHPGAILPLAITVEIAREVLAEHDFDPNVITLAADEAGAPITKELVMRPQVGIIDYTGSSAFGDWIEQNARHAVVFTEKAGVNSTILDSCANLKAVSSNLAFSLSLYSGQMCTTPQNLFVPKSGIEVGGEQTSSARVAEAIAGAVNWLLSDAGRAAEILGAIQNEATLARIEAAAGEGGEVIRASEPVRNESFPEARVRSPLILKVDAADEQLYMREMFGPIAYIVATESTEQSIGLAAACARQVGSITCGAYSTKPEVLRAAEDATADAGAPLSCNLTGQIFVNQAAAFSDFHVSGANPAGNATLTDGAFIARRFRVVQSRVPV